MVKSSCFILVFVLSIANCQFYYNYEENTPVEEETDTQNFHPSAYQYNTPLSANQQYVQSVGRNDEPEVHRKTRIRVKSRNYQSEPNDNQPQQEIQHAPEVDQRALRQERRQAKRRQRQRQREFAVEPVLPPRVYPPSVFENVGLGEAPTGIYIPQDSFLNVLRNQRTDLPSPVSQPIAVVPQTTNYVQPSAGYANNRNQSPFFVQPPSEEPRQRNLILPATRHQVEYTVSTPRQTTNEFPNTPSQARAIGTNRRPRQRIRIQPKHAEPPTVDIDSLREYTDDVSRENLMSQVQYVPVNITREPRPHNRRRTIPNYQESTPALREYSPSVFEKVPLGEAPSGVYVPDDSLLNILRSSSSRRHASPVVSREVTNIPLEQPTTYSALNDYEAGVIGEEQYQPPPPSPPTRRRSSHRSRQMQVPKQSQRQRYQDTYEQVPRSIQPSSQRSQQNENFEDFQRERSTVQTQEPSHRRRASAQPRTSAAAPRTQHQASTSDRNKPTFRKAKLAIAELPLDTDEDGIPGEAGVDYPTLHVIPRTAFTCSQQPHNGYYADLETSCQVVHLCQSRGVQNSFLCPNGTIFSQEKFSCQWWYKVSCSESPKFYGKNDELYKVPVKEERKRN